MQKTYTLVLATRLKRRIFTAGGVRAELEELAKRFCIEYEIGMVKLEILEYGCIFVYVCGDACRYDACTIASRFRYFTSGKLRYDFAELWKMPSLWTKRCLIKEGGFGGVGEELDEFFSSIKTR